MMSVSGILFKREHVTTLRESNNLTRKVAHIMIEFQLTPERASHLC